MPHLRIGHTFSLLTPSQGMAAKAGKELKRNPLVAADTLLGIGMGGFVDGILFHQILQLHNMLSARIPPPSLINVETTMVWDGFFHAFAWSITLMGIVMLMGGKLMRTADDSVP